MLQLVVKEPLEILEEQHVLRWVGYDPSNPPHINPVIHAMSADEGIESEAADVDEALESARVMEEANREQMEELGRQHLEELAQQEAINLLYPICQKATNAAILAKVKEERKKKI